MQKWRDETLAITAYYTAKAANIKAKLSSLIDPKAREKDNKRKKKKLMSQSEVAVAAMSLLGVKPAQSTKPTKDKP